MSTQSVSLENTIYYPLNQGERANHLYVDQLLPRSIYERLAELLAESLQQLPPSTAMETDEQQEFSRRRGHTTIFLDGDRGTGKTTVMVNLQAYLQAPEVRARFAGLADQVHVLQPIDPSQLEDNDDLFLNVIVAAVLGDDEIKRGKERNPECWQALYNSLQLLGTALAGKETQSDGVGLDRLRSFMGAQELAGAVHDFFVNAARLLNKRLLVLPIDDVDTTLHRAFENLEVVRRYLASPVLVPIVCGDLRLYHDVTWRDAFRRLTTDIVGFYDEAKSTAESLALEYLRKILPLHRRLRMPEVDTFLHNDKVLLGTPRDRDTPPRLTLPNLEAWLTALLAGPVNNHENSRLHIPIPTVRALSQLLSRVREEISDLELAFHGETAPSPITDLMRRIMYWRNGEAPQYRRNGMDGSEQATASDLSKGEWQTALLDHFMFEPDAGAVCLVLMAAQHWQDSPNTSVLATPLFTPLKQVGHPTLRYIQSRAALNWTNDLSGRLPDSWVSELASESVLPFASPEIGRAVVADGWHDKSKISSKAFPIELSNVLIDLITHRNFYSPSKRATLICSGRILELIATSLVRNVSPLDIDRILSMAPYHSAVSVAGTKAVQISIDEIEESSESEAIDDAKYQEESYGEDATDAHLMILRQDRDLTIHTMASEINIWRDEVQANRLPLSPWLIYCALNKTFNQVPFFTRPLQYNEQPNKEALSNVAASGLSAFNSFWAAIASFEKGPLFGLPLELSNVNLINRRGDFLRTDLFTQNIKPLLKDDQRTFRGEQLISTTSVLNKHPLRRWLKEFFEHTKQLETPLPRSESEVTDGRVQFLKNLGFAETRRRVTVADLVKALERNAPKGVPTLRYAQALLQQTTRNFPKLKELSTLKRAIAELQKHHTGSN